MGEQPQVRERMVKPRAAERAEHGDPRRAAPDRLDQRQLGVGFVLVDPGAQDRDAVRGRGLGEGRREGVQVPHQQVHAQAQRAGAHEAPVRRDDLRHPGVPAGPGRVQGTPRGHVAIRDHERVAGRAGRAGGCGGVGGLRGVGHRPIVPVPGARGAGAFVYPSAVPDTPLPLPTQRVIDAASRKGVSLDVHTFAESTHTAEDAAAAVGAELGQIVKSLRKEQHDMLAIPPEIRQVDLLAVKSAARLI